MYCIILFNALHLPAKVQNIYKSKYERKNPTKFYEIK